MIGRRRFTIALYLGALIVLLDQLSKWWVLNIALKDDQHLMPVTGFLNIVLVLNRGVTFGMLSRLDHHLMSYFLVAVAAVIIFLLGRWLWRTSSTLVAVGLGAVMGGAIGNVLDRLRYGAVVDFIDFYYQNYHWYAFNIADAAIVTGVCLLLLDNLVRGK